MNNPYAKLGGGALDQELFKKKPQQEEANPQVEVEEKKITKNSQTPLSQPKNSEEKSNCQLNAWITTDQDLMLTNALYKLKSQRVKVKKGELIGIAIEVLSRILENQSPTKLGVSILDQYIEDYEKKK
jgi:hypothetical protein